MPDDTYIVAVRRSQRGLAPEDWVDRLRRTEGVSVMGETYGRAQITADPRGLERVLDELGDYLVVEPLIRHDPSDDEDG